MKSTHTKQKGTQEKDRAHYNKNIAAATSAKRIWVCRQKQKIPKLEQACAHHTNEMAINQNMQSR